MGERDEEQTTLPPGTVLDGKYRIIEPLGEGGMGVVYRAEHLLMRKEVALKRLHPHLSSIGQIVQRFEREAQAAARIDHPNVCLVTDCGHDAEGGLFIVMEILRGMTLADIMDEEVAVPFHRLRNIAMQMCSALDRAHGLGIVHRDLKPENIMLVEREGVADHVKIMDFGIARMVSDESPGTSLTQAGMIFGTPSYLSPEQASGDPVDHRGDLYSLGVILFEMATGRKPFEAKTAALLMRMHVTTEPPLLSEVAPGIDFPPGFQQVVSRLLAKNPADRYPSAKVCRDHLEALEPSAGVGAEIVDATTRPLAAPGEAMDRLPDAGLEAISVPAVSGHEASTADESFIRLWKRGGWFRQAVLAGVILVAALVIGTVLFVSLGKQSKDHASPDGVVSDEAALALLEQARSEFGENPDVKSALTDGMEGRGPQAIGKLEKLRSGASTGGSPHLYYHLAILYSNEGRMADALASIDACLAAEPGYAADPTLISIEIECLRDPETAKQASKVMTAHPSRTLALRIESIAREETDERLRGLALKALMEGDMMRHLPQWQQVAIELADPFAGVPCQERRRLIGELAAAGEPAALGTLALFREKGGCEEEGKSDCWSCLRPDWQKAVDALEAARKKGEGAKPGK